MIRIGIDLGGTKIEAIALDPDGAERARERIETPRNYSETLDAITALVRHLEADLEARSQPARIGIGHPGSISPATGRIRNANSTWLNGQPLKTDLEVRLGRPVRMANDADCFTLSEAVDGAGKDSRVVFGVIIGTGVGGGICIDQQLLSGAQRIAGEWGHNPLPWPQSDELPGPQCWCGLSGCIETWLSGPGFARDHGIASGANPDAREIAALAAAGDDIASASLGRYVDRLSRGLASVLNLIDADCVVLGGGMSNTEGLPERVEAGLGRYLFSDVVKTRIVRHAHGDSSGVRGAAWLWDAGE